MSKSIKPAAPAAPLDPTLAESLAWLSDPVTFAIALRFVRKIHICPDSGCWLWRGCVQDSSKRFRGAGRAPDWRGRFRWGARIVYAHRAAWCLWRGDCPDDLVVMHSECDNSICVNPWHLGLGTQDDNLADMRAKRRDAVSRAKATAA